MKRQNFIRKIAKSTQEEYGPEFTDFELDAVLMTLENFGFDVNTLFKLSDGEPTEEDGKPCMPYIDLHWDDEDYLQQDADYCAPNGFQGQQGADVTRIDEKYSDDDVFDIKHHDGMVIYSEKKIHKYTQVRVYYARLDYKSYRRKGGFEGMGHCKHHLIGVRLLNHGLELPIDEFKNCIILKKDKERMIVTITDGLLTESGYSPDMYKVHSDDMSDIDKLTHKEIALLNV